MAAAQAAEELAEMSPEDEQYLLQLLAGKRPAEGPLEVVQNILDERIPLEKRLPKLCFRESTPPPKKKLPQKLPLAKEEE